VHHRRGRPQALTGAEIRFSRTPEYPPEKVLIHESEDFRTGLTAYRHDNRTRLSSGISVARE
jgi:hypothetical protein